MNALKLIAAKSLLNVRNDTDVSRDSANTGSEQINAVAFLAVSLFPNNPRVGLNSFGGCSGRRQWIATKNLGPLKMATTQCLPYLLHKPFISIQL